MKKRESKISFDCPFKVSAWNLDLLFNNELVKIGVNYTPYIQIHLCMYIFAYMLNLSVRNGHGGGTSRKVNAWYLYTLMVYL